MNASNVRLLKKTTIIYSQISKYPFLLPDESWFISTDHWVDILDRNLLTLGIKKDNRGKFSRSDRADQTVDYLFDLRFYLFLATV